MSRQVPKPSVNSGNSATDSTTGPVRHAGRARIRPAARRLAVIAALPALAIALTTTGGRAADNTAGAPSGGSPGWVTTWGGSAMSPSALVSSVQSLNNQTARNIIYTSAGGSELRIRVSNAFGAQPETIGAASAARQLRGAQIDPATVHQLTFGGRASVQIPQGGSVLSDPVRMGVPALSNLAISLYLPNPTGQVTYHQDPQQTNYLASGDHTGDTGDSAFTTTVGEWFFLDAVQVRTQARGAVIAFGDSITDGFQSQTNANTRWPNFLARRLSARFGSTAPAVVDEGISGNRILNDSVCFGVNAPARLDRDAFSQPGARTMILLEGINDLGFSQSPDSGCTAPNTDVSAAQLIAAYQRIIALAHAHGLRIIAGTITPATGVPNYWDARAEAKRQVINAFIRGSHAFDGVIDFASVLAYPGHPELIDPKFDSGDHLHPNDAGYQAMADAIDLGMITH